MKGIDLQRLQQLRQMCSKVAPLLTEDEVRKLKTAVNRLNEIMSNGSSAINGDPVVFKTIDELMVKADKKAYGSIASEDIEG